MSQPGGRAEHEAGVRVSVVCTAANCEDTIALFVKRLADEMNRRRHSWNLVIVDDSDDTTPMIVEDLAAGGYPIRLLRRGPTERVGGYSGALVEGFSAADAELIVVVDPDLRESPETIGRLLDALEAGADVVIGSRFHPDSAAIAFDGWIARMASRAVTLVTTRLFREVRGLTDPASSLFAFRTRVIQGVVLRPEHFRVIIEILVRGTWQRCTEVPSDYVGKVFQSKNLTPRQVALFLSRLVRLWLETRMDPMRFADAAPARADALSASLPWGDAPADGPPATGRILMVASELPPTRSGVARTVARVGEELMTRGYEVHYRSGSDAWRARLGEFRVSALGLHLLRHRHHRQFDAVVLHGPVPTVTELVLASHWFRRRGRIPLVYVHHFDIELRFLGVPSLLYNVVNHRLCANADRVITSSHSYAHVLRRRAGERVHVIPWGVDPVRDPFTRSMYDGSRPLGVLFVGQQRDYKGVSNLIHAIAGEPALRLTVVGDGPLLERHMRLVEQLGCTNVDVVGPVDDDELRHHYLDHEVIALPSVTKVEAFGVVLLEGMQMGCVPIASDLAGVRDVVGGDGILTPPRRIVSLRDELRRLAAHPHEVRSRSVAASERAAHFTWMRTGELYAALVAELTGAGS